jgi:hypothetical protein
VTRRRQRIDDWARRTFGMRHEALLLGFSLQTLLVINSLRCCTQTLLLPILLLLLLVQLLRLLQLIAQALHAFQLLELLTNLVRLLRAVRLV